jgi:hypothetical protein
MTVIGAFRAVTVRFLTDDRLHTKGIVAKQKFGTYITEREYSTWFKILNRKYSQKNGREDLNVSGIRSLYRDGILACWRVPICMSVANRF